MVSKRYIASSLRYHMAMFLRYRLKVVTSFFSEILFPIAVNILFVVGLTDDASTGLTPADLVQYVITANLIFMFSMSDLDCVVAKDIKSYQLIYKMEAPVSPWLQYVLSDLFSKLGNLLLFYVPFFLIMAVLGNGVTAPLPLIAVFLWISVVLGYCISFIIGSLAFWLTEVWGVAAIKNLVLSVFSGTIFPFSLLPNAVQNLMNCLPFQYISYIPASILSGTVDLRDAPTLLLGGVFWSALFLLVAALIWRCGLRKYEGAGT